MKTRVLLALVLGLIAMAALPGTAFAQEGLKGVKTELDMTWVMVGTVLVVLMQAGFLLLEIGFSRPRSRRG